MLDIKQPDANRRRQNRYWQVNQQEWPEANQPDNRGDKNRDGDVRTHCTQPGPPAVTHHPNRQPMPQDEQIRGTHAKHHNQMPVETIEDCWHLM